MDHPIRDKEKGPGSDMHGLAPALIQLTTVLREENVYRSAGDVLAPLATSKHHP
jgi:hypothetical protein